MARRPFRPHVVRPGGNGPPSRDARIHAHHSGLAVSVVPRGAIRKLLARVRASGAYSPSGALPGDGRSRSELRRDVMGGIGEFTVDDGRAELGRIMGDR